MKFPSRFFAALSALALFPFSYGCSLEEGTESAELPTDTRSMTTAEVVAEMGVGWNLGNTLESCTNTSPYYASECETLWGNPYTTREMIQAVSDAGFNTVRIPVAWSNMMSSVYQIDQDFMARVEEVVDYVLDCGMYAIIDIHWDNGWIYEASTNYDSTMRKYTDIWKQVSENFAGHSDYLIFESLNEEGEFTDIWKGTGTSGKAEAYALLNDFNQTFVDTVRASGGRNATRHLLLAGYADDAILTCDPLYVLPEDPAGRCAVSIHYNVPVDFVDVKTNDGGADKWGTDDERKELEENFDRLKTTFCDNGVPVIISEYGAATLNKNPDSIVDYTASVTKAARSRGMCPILWDNGTFFDRNGLSFTNTELLNELKKYM